MSMFIEPIGKLINEFTKLPGVGTKTAQRFAYEIINMSKEDAEAFAESIINCKIFSIAFENHIKTLNILYKTYSPNKTLSINLTFSTLQAIKTLVSSEATLSLSKVVEL